MAAPIAAIDQLTIVSTDGAGAIPRQVTDNIFQTLSMLKTSTGLDLEAMIKTAVSRTAGGTSGEVVPPESRR